MKNHNKRKIKILYQCLKYGNNEIMNTQIIKQQKDEIDESQIHKNQTNKGMPYQSINNKKNIKSKQKKKQNQNKLQ